MMFGPRVDLAICDQCAQVAAGEGDNQKACALLLEDDDVVMVYSPPYVLTFGNLHGELLVVTERPQATHVQVALEGSDYPQWIFNLATQDHQYHLLLSFIKRAYLKGQNV